MNKNKFTPLTYIIVTTIAILAFLILLALDGRQSGESNNSDIGVTGFGVEATRDYFPVVVDALNNTECEKVFHEGSLQDPRFPYLQELGTELTVTKLPNYNNVALHCYYEFGNDQGFILQFYTYGNDTVIDQTRDDLFSRVNSEYIGELIDKDRIGIMDYSFGTDLNSSECTSTIYHPLNEFEVITVEYFGFDCEESFNLNREVVAVIGHYTFFMIETLYALNDTSTAQQLGAWGYEEYLDSLTFYK